LCEGDLRGMFDGATSPGLDLDARLVVLDLSAVRDSAALGILMTCAAAWLQGIVLERKRAAEAGKRDGAKVIVAVDEAWRITADLGVAEWLQSSFKLSRAHGVQNIIALHRLSDLGAAGAQGSRESRIAEGLIADADTRVVLAQPPDQIDGLRSLLGLTATEAELVPTLRRGEGLWQVGRRSFLVQHRLSSAEMGFVDTDARMVRHRELTGAT
jgi:TraG P-loop domain